VSPLIADPVLRELLAVRARVRKSLWGGARKTMLEILDEHIRGRVFKAHGTSLDTNVALKIITALMTEDHQRELAVRLAERAREEQVEWEDADFLKVRPNEEDT
jgi:hypothetical protein